MARKLRIAVSVLFSAIALALCVLWVRSYGRGCSVSWASNNNSSVGFVSTAGEMRFSSMTLPAHIRIVPGWTFGSSDLEHEKLALQLGPRLQWHSDRRGDRLILPHWFLAAVGSTLGVAPLLPWSRRFSLRSLLMATTLMAVVLGLAVWAGK